MTVCGQNLHYTELTTLNDMLESGQIREQDLATIVQDAIRDFGTAQLIDRIDEKTRELIQGGSGVRVVAGIVDQSVNRQVEQVVDKAIADALVGRSSELQSAIEEVVKRSVEAKLNALLSAAKIKEK